MRSEISEFSYGFALTDELIHSYGVPLTGAPVFPSLYDEGQTGGGWDLRLDRPGIPLFVQFKLSECLTRRNCNEVRRGLLPVPCYRLHLRPTRFSRQHELLLELEGQGHEVYYTAPAFYKPEELNDSYLNHQVRARSIWIKPSQIGPLPDNRNHHVSFQHPDGEWYFCSEPKVLHGKKSYKDFIEDITEKVRTQGNLALTRPELEKLARNIMEVAERRPDIGVREKQAARRVLVDAQPLKQISYYASVFLECQLFIINEEQPNTP
jgi:hypothetical protein